MLEHLRNLLVFLGVAIVLSSCSHLPIIAKGNEIVLSDCIVGWVELEQEELEKGKK